MPSTGPSNAQLWAETRLTASRTNSGMQDSNTRPRQMKNRPPQNFQPCWLTSGTRRHRAPRFFPSVGLSETVTDVSGAHAPLPWCRGRIPRTNSFFESAHFRDRASLQPVLSGPSDNHAGRQWRHFCLRSYLLQRFHGVTRLPRFSRMSLVLFNLVAI